MPKFRLRRCNNCNKEYTPVKIRSTLCPECDEYRKQLIAAAETRSNAIKYKYSSQNFLEVPPLHLIKQELDQYVIGQEHAKRTLSLAVYNHLKRINLMFSNPDTHIDKSNVIIAGPSGCGKTYLIKKLAELFDLPYCIVDATTYTEAGFVGADVESMLEKLYLAANKDLQRAEKGIIFIDEIDKKACKNASHLRDAARESVQQALLKMIEGTVVDVNISSEPKNSPTSTIQINTENILFVVSGAFVGLEKIIQDRLYPQQKQSITINSQNHSSTTTHKTYNELITKATSDDFQRFGLIPEFIGRLPLICPIQQLTEDDLVKIMTQPKNALINQYKLLYAEDDIDLKFTPTALREIARIAIKAKTGARSLRCHLDSILTDVGYDAITKDKSTITIDLASVKNYSKGVLAND